MAGEWDIVSSEPVVAAKTPTPPEDEWGVVSTEPVTPSAYAKKGQDINAQYKAWQTEQAKKATIPAETTPEQKAKMTTWLQGQADLINPMMVGQGGLTPENVQTQAGAYKLQGIAQEQQATMRSDLYGKSEKEQRAWKPNTLEYLANPEVSFGAKALSTLTGGVSVMPFEELDPMSFSSPQAYNKARTGQVVAEFISNPILYAPVGWSGLPANFETKLAKVLETVPVNTPIKDTMGIVTKELQNKGEIKTPAITKENYDEPLPTSLTKEEPSVKIDEQVSQNPLLQLKKQNEHEYYRTLDNNLDPAVFKTLDVPTQEATLNALKNETFTSRTGLGNRAAYYQKLNEKTAKGEQPKTIFFDTSGLKNVNDRLGHAAGDVFLNAFGNIAGRIFGKDNAFHISGDEFVAFAKNDEEASKLRAKFDEATAAHKFEVTDNHGNVHQIDGIRAVSGHGNSLKEADDAVNKFKDEGAIQDVLSGKINPEDLARRHVDLALNPEVSSEYREATKNLFLQRIEQLSKQEPSVQTNKGDTAERGVLQGVGQEVRGVEEQAAKDQQYTDITKADDSPIITGDGEMLGASFNTEIQNVKQVGLDEKGVFRMRTPDSIPASSKKLRQLSDAAFNPDILSHFSSEPFYKNFDNFKNFYNTYFLQFTEAAEKNAAKGLPATLNIAERLNSNLTRTAKREYDYLKEHIEPLNALWDKFKPKEREELIRAQELSMAENRLMEPVEYFRALGIELSDNQMSYLIKQQQFFQKAFDDMIENMRILGKDPETIQAFIENTKRGYYLPTTRKGDKLFLVFDNLTNKTIAAVGSEGKAEYNKVAQHLAEKFHEDRYSIKAMDNVKSYLGDDMNVMMVEKLQQKAEKLLNKEVEEGSGILKSYYDLAEEPIAQAYKEAAKGKGQPNYLARKKNIAGYDTDFHQYTKDYAASVAGYLENQLYKHDLYDTTLDSSGDMIGLWHRFEKEQGTKSRWKEYVADHLKYVLTPTEEAAKVRAFMFAYFLATNPSSTLLNFANILTTLLPNLTRFGAGVGNAEMQVMSAMSRITPSGRFLRKDEKRLLEYMTENGGINQFLTQELVGHSTAKASDLLKRGYYEEQLKAKTIPGQIGKKVLLAPNMLVTLGAAGFTHLDQYTRMIAAIAHYNTALKLMREHPDKWARIKQEKRLKGLSEEDLAFDFAFKGSKDTMFDYSKMELPGIAKMTLKVGDKQIPVGRVFFQFKMFALNYMKFLAKITKEAPQSPEQMAAAIKAWAILVGLSGVNGIPFGKYIDAGVEDITGHDNNYWIRKWLGKNFASKTLSKGVFSNFGVDVGRRLALNLAPEVSEKDTSTTGLGKFIHAVSTSAPAIGFEQRMEKAAGEVLKAAFYKKGDKFTREQRVMRALETLAPVGILSNGLTAMQWHVEGNRIKDKNNQTIISDITTSEKLTKALGFIPERVSEAYSRIQENQKR